MDTKEQPDWSLMLNKLVLSEVKMTTQCIERERIGEAKECRRLFA
ncbi:uncharacterized protein G2W53_002179 [Senna tora]|uniref:Uncharacterized protein n=1 Tax=Senna tora TaxID=362788 RepID=A0A834XHB7_9FABA|nr:uncharacterized protein G2W53_002179 [Senna tora]